MRKPSVAWEAFKHVMRREAEMRAELTKEIAQVYPVEPEAFVLLPFDPTQIMLTAGAEAIRNTLVSKPASYHELAAACFAAMRDNSPKG